MASVQEIKNGFASLEERIQKLITLHEEAKNANAKLLAEKRQVIIELEEEREKTRRMHEGYKNLKEMERSSSISSITNMKKKINDLI
jgi:hypothetical protein